MKYGITIGALLLLSQTGCKFLAGEEMVSSQSSQGMDLGSQTYAQTSASVTKIVAKQLQVKTSQIKPSVPLANQKIADELDVVEVVMNLEETYRIVISDEEIATGKIGKDQLEPYKKVTLQRLINIVWRKRGELRK